MNAAEKAILKAIINGTLTELLMKTSAEQVYLDETTTLATKLTEMVASINLRAKTEDMNTAIANATSALRQELLGSTPEEAYNTFTELAAYIAEHQDVADALTSAIGDKADKSTVEALQASITALGALASKDKVSEDDLDAALREKVNAASEGNHSHLNKDTLDGITPELVAAWNGKSKVYFAATQPAALTANDLWVQLSS